MKRTEFRIPAELAAWLKKKAAEEHRSMNAQLIHILEKLKESEK